jgi:hypothetical protein
MRQYNGFDYEEFWEFIVDYFEDDETEEAKEASTKLLEWWNKYVSSPSSSPPLLIIYSPGKFFQGPQPHAMQLRHQQHGHPLRSYDNNVKRLPAHLTRPHS